MGKKAGKARKPSKTSKASDNEHPLHAEIEVLLKAYEAILVAAQKKYRDPNVIAATLLGIHVSVGSMLLESVTKVVERDIRGARK